MALCDRYKDARELFVACRDAALEAERVRRRAMAMEASEGVRGGSLAGGGRGVRADPHGMGRTDARIDFEARWERRLEEDHALIDEACALIYGPDNHGGVEKLLGSAVADTLWWRYCAAETWERVSREVGYSVSWCKQLAERGIDVVDCVGFYRAKCGQGVAEA